LIWLFTMPAKNEDETRGPDEKNKWKQLVVTPDDKIAPPVAKSQFRVKFPAHREHYLKAAWPEVNKMMQKFGIKAILDLVEGEMKVQTTRKMWDPWAIMNARDFIQLLARSVPLMQAIKIFDDDMYSQIVQLRKSNRTSKETFVKRRQRLIGPNGSTLKALELLTDCYILVQGNTVAIMGPFRGVDEVQEICRECMRNIHPVYKIKELMIKRELQKNPKLKDENWDRFLPKFKKKTVKRKKPHKLNAKSKSYSPFPPEQPKSKKDIQLETGEYFLNEKSRLKAKRFKQREKQIEKTKERKRKRKENFVPPKEIKRKKVEKEDIDVKSLASKLRNQLGKKK